MWGQHTALSAKAGKGDLVRGAFALPFVGDLDGSRVASPRRKGRSYCLRLLEYPENLGDDVNMILVRIAVRHPFDRALMIGVFAFRP